MKKVAIIMGSETDHRVMQGAEEVLKEFGVPVHVEVVSAHRSPEKMVAFAKSAHESYSVIIAGAGGAAHLPGMVASLTTLPVIGVPVELKALKGMDSLLSIVQMPKGVPVATVGIENAANAGLLAVRILSVSEPKLQKKLMTYQKVQLRKVKTMNQNLKKSRRK